TRAKRTISQASYHPDRSSDPRINIQVPPQGQAHEKATKRCDQDSKSMPTWGVSCLRIVLRLFPFLVVSCGEYATCQRQRYGLNRASPRALGRRNHILRPLGEVRTQRERAVVVQLLVTRPPHGIAHPLYFNRSSKYQSFPICDIRKHELSLPNLAR